VNAGSNQDPFRVGFSADFLDEQGRLIFPDIGLDLFNGQPGLEYEFLPEYLKEYIATAGRHADEPI
jgi:hypothetical protein